MLHTCLQEIQDLFKPNPYVKSSTFDVAYELTATENDTHMIIHVKQYVFTLGTITISKSDDSFHVKSIIQKDIFTGTGFIELKQTLIELGFVKTAQRKMAAIYTSAVKPKNKYPRKGRVNKR